MFSVRNISCDLCGANNFKLLISEYLKNINIFYQPDSDICTTSSSGEYDIWSNICCLKIAEEENILSISE